MHWKSINASTTTLESKSPTEWLVIEWGKYCDPKPLEDAEDEANDADDTETKKAKTTTMKPKETDFIFSSFFIAYFPVVLAILV